MILQPCCEPLVTNLAVILTHILIASSCPDGNTDSLRFSSKIEDVRRLIATTPNTAADEDGIPGKVLKLLSCELAEPLNIIFQWSIAESTFPAAWKNSIVQLIFKGKDEKSTTTFYRPVTICATLGKVLERLIKEQLLQVSLSNNIFSCRQHGFIPNRSTLTNLLELGSILADWDIKSQLHDIISFDFSRAFDKVAHALLLDTIAATYTPRIFMLTAQLLVRPITADQARE